MAVLMLMADIPGGLKVTRAIRVDRVQAVAFRAGDDPDVPLFEYLDGSAAHAARDDELYAHVGQKVGQKARLMTRIRGHSLGYDDIINCFVDCKSFAMTKVFCYLIPQARYSDLHNFSPFYVIICSSRLSSQLPSNSSIMPVSQARASLESTGSLITVWI